MKAYFHVIQRLFFLVLLQHNADPLVKNTDGKTPLDLADASAKNVLTGKFCPGLSIYQGIFNHILSNLIS